MTFSVYVFGIISDFPYYLSFVSFRYPVSFVSLSCQFRIIILFVSYEYPVSFVRLLVSFACMLVTTPLVQT